MPNDMGDCKVADIKVGATDSAGDLIVTVYSKVARTYAVYRTSARVLVEYADDPNLGSDQRKALVPLNPLTGEINGLIDGWRSSPRENEAANARLFDRRVADALQVGLQGGINDALTVLSAVKNDILTMRTAIARSRYVVVAAATTLILVAIFVSMTSSLFAHLFKDFDRGTNQIWSAAAIGAIGAWFSIALAIRRREVQTDLQSLANDIDAVLRVLIGTISAGIIISLLELKLASFSLGGGQPIDLAKGPGLVVAAFAAGFSERLVDNILNQTIAAALKASGVTANQAVKAAPATPPPATSEKNPLGKTDGAPTPPPPSVDDGDDEDDNCNAGATLSDADATPDQALPAATGGVETAS